MDSVMSDTHLLGNSLRAMTWILVSGECAVDPYPVLVLLGYCQSPSSSRPASETLYCLDGGVLDTFLHKPWLQRRPSYHKYQGSNIITVFIHHEVHFTYPFLLMSYGYGMTAQYSSKTTTVH
jgi:hypothetical protein